ncbi:hypothetical protein LEP1GSC188_0571 [Leptospira weilii serovar Topaz str. LT2116]|uniref:Uncharacterized protein n=1 Tax=Leptospira weilii serovar Topaz str. LT2116 TaxID=1088540 RepID=M3FQF7_9LEPT|nr:hypothetical protein LEP1GSC188_0571 [Leptospira weilii serovar Topaz str. LT2116]
MPVSLKNVKKSAIFRNFGVWQKRNVELRNLNSNISKT